MATNWPITGADLRKALEYTVDQDDAGELALFAASACRWIDEATGRDVEPNRHELPGGALPVTFIMAARRQGKLMWEQEKNGRQAEGRAGVGLASSVVAMLEPYPPRPGFGS